MVLAAKVVQNPSFLFLQVLRQFPCFRVSVGGSNHTTAIERLYECNTQISCILCKGSLSERLTTFPSGSGLSGAVSWGCDFSSSWSFFLHSFFLPFFLYMSAMEYHRVTYLHTRHIHSNQDVSKLTYAHCCNNAHEHQHHHYHYHYRNCHPCPCNKRRKVHTNITVCIKPTL